MKKKNIAISIFLLLILVFFIFPLIFKEIPSFILASKLNAKVKVRAIKISTHRIEAVNLTLKDKKNNKILEVEKLSIDYKLNGIPQEGFLQSIERISLFTPRIWLAREEDGSWNTSSLSIFKKRKPVKVYRKVPKKEFSGIVEVFNGNFNICDKFIAKAKSNVFFDCDFNFTYPVAGIKFNARDGASALNISGSFDPEGRNTGIVAEGRDLELNKFLNYFFTSGDFLAKAGSMDLSAKIFVKNYVPCFAGTLKLKNAGFFIKDIPYPLNNINGDVFVENNCIYSKKKLTGSFGSIPIFLSGEIKNLPDSEFNIKATAENFNLMELDRFWKDRLKVKINALTGGVLMLDGPWWALEYDCILQSPVVNFGRDVLRDSRLEFRFMGNAFYVSNFASNWHGAKIEGGGWYFYKKPEAVLMRFNIKNVAPLNFFKKNFLKNSAKLETSFIILGSPDDPLILGEGRLKGLFDDEETADFLYGDKALYVFKDRMFNKGKKAKLRGYGYFNFKDKIFDLYLKAGNASFCNIDTSVIKNIGGNLNFQAFCSGSFTKPNLLFSMKESTLNLNSLAIGGINSRFLFDGSSYWLDNSSTALDFSGLSNEKTALFLFEAKDISAAGLKSAIPFLEYFPLNNKLSASLYFAGMPGHGYFYDFKSLNSEGGIELTGAFKENPLLSGVSCIKGRGFRFDNKFDFASGTIQGGSLIFKEKERFNIYGNISLLNGKLFKFPVSSACFHVGKGQFGWNLQDIDISGSSGSFRLNGSLNEKSIDLSYYIYNFGLKEFNKFSILPFSGGKNIFGSVTSSGKIKGGFRNPSINGTFAVKRGVAGSSHFDLFGKFDFYNNDLEFSPLNLKQAGGELKVIGSMKLVKIPGFSLKVSVENYRLENLFGFTPMCNMGLDGILNSSMVIDGDIKKPLVEGQLKVEDASFFGQRIENLFLELKSGGGKFNLSRLFLKIKKGEIFGSGEFSAKPFLNFNFYSNDFPLEEMPFLSRMPLKLDGLGDFNISVVGSPNDPEVNGSILVKKGEINGEKFDLISGIISWSKNCLSLNPLKLTYVDEVYQLAGKIYFQGRKFPNKISHWFREDTSPALDLQAEINKGKISKILGILGSSLKEKISGSISSTISINGKINNPKIEASANFADCKVGDGQLSSSVFDCDYENYVLEIKKFNLVQPKGSFEASGRFDFNGEGSLMLSARNFDLKVLSPFLSREHAFSGFMDLDLNVSGPTYTPAISSNFNVKDIGLDKILFDNFRGKITGRDGFINLVGLQLIKDKHRGTISGRIPLIWKKGGFYSSADIDVEASFNESDLSLLNIFGNIIETSSGAFSGTCKAFGSLDDVDVFGSANIKNGNVKLVKLGSPIEDLNVNLILDKEKLDVKDFRGRMGPGAFKLSGDIGFSGLHPEKIDLKLALDQLLVIATPYLQGKFDGLLNLTGSLKDMLLSGKINISDGTVNLQSFNSEKSKTGVSGVKAGDLKFYVDLALSNVWINNRAAILQTFFKSNGFLEIRGSMPGPSLAGQIDFRQGNIVFYNTSFKVNDGVAHFDGTSSWDPNIDLSAQTRVGTTNVYVDVSGNINRPVWDATSDPPLTKQEILGLIAGKVIPFIAESGVSGILRDTMSHYLVGTLQAALLQPILQSIGQSFALGDVGLEYVPPGYWMLKFAKALDVDEKFYITYSKVFGNTGQIQLQFQNFWGLEYKLQRKMVVSISRNEYGEYVYGIQARYQH